MPRHGPRARTASTRSSGRTSRPSLRVSRCLVLVIRRVPVRAPVALVGTGVRIEDDDAAIAVPVGHVDLVRLGIHHHRGRLVEVLQIVAVRPAVVPRSLPAVRLVAADLHDERAVFVELQDPAVFLTVAAGPDEPLVIDMQPVLGLRPVALPPGIRDLAASFGRGTAPAGRVADRSPRLHEVAVLVVHDVRRRRVATVRRHTVGGVALARHHRGAVDEPDAVLRVHRDADHGAVGPVVRQRRVARTAILPRCPHLPRRSPCRVEHAASVLGECVWGHPLSQTVQPFMGETSQI